MKSYRSLYTIALATIFLVSFQFMNATWVAPSAIPPGDNVAAPLNVSATTQYKEGNLSVNILQSTTAVWSNAYCDVMGVNCFSPVNPSGLPKCTNGQTLVADATGTWVCGAPSPTAPTVVWLVNGQHSESQCTALGGTVVMDGSNRFCRFNQASCPTGWVSYLGWSTGSSRFCGGSGRAATACTVNGWAWSNFAGPRSCGYSTTDFETKNAVGQSCPAPITQIGCY